MTKEYKSIFFKTMTNKKQDLAEKKWFLIDAAENQGLILGRLAAYVSHIIRGKHKPKYSAGVDMGDHVIIVNADKILLTGNKLTQRIHYKHLGYIGHLREKTPQMILKGKKPEELIINAVQKMMFRAGSFRDTSLGNLRVYTTPTHPHTAQNPQKINFSVMNRKNSCV